jgi:hypothetical protein
MVGTTTGTLLVIPIRTEEHPGGPQTSRHALEQPGGVHSQNQRPIELVNHAQMLVANESSHCSKRLDSCGIRGRYRKIPLA